MGETTDHALVSIRPRHLAFSSSWSGENELRVVFLLDHINSNINPSLQAALLAVVPISIIYMEHEIDVF